MRPLIIITITALVAKVALAQNCPDTQHWGPGCMNYCGECFTSAPGSARCDPNTGDCPSGCLEGYSGQRCDQPKCEQDCGPGECIAPNFCGNCGHISYVSPNCEDIRLRGLLGSFAAFVVITVSITLCGIGSVWYKRQKNTAVVL